MDVKLARNTGIAGKNIRSFVPNRNDGGSSKFNNKIRLFVKSGRAPVFLFALAGTLLLAAVLIFVVQWNEGETAERKAGRLLSEASLEPSPSPSELFPKGAYVQPEQPDAQGEEEIKGLLETELKGYSVIARLDIDKIEQHLPVLSSASDKALKVSVCYYTGSLPGEDGNLVITGHNYRNGAHFGNLDKLEEGDAVTLMDTQGKTYAYTVYGIDHIKPDNPEALDNTVYERELTLLTCEARGNGRLVVRCCLKDE